MGRQTKESYPLVACSKQIWDQGEDCELWRDVIWIDDSYAEEGI